MGNAFLQVLVFVPQVDVPVVAVIFQRRPNGRGGGFQIQLIVDHHEFVPRYADHSLDDELNLGTAAAVDVEVDIGEGEEENQLLKHLDDHRRFFIDGGFKNDDLAPGD